MSTIPVGALPINQTALVPKRLLIECEELIKRLEDLDENSQDRAVSILREIDSYVNPPNAKYKKR